MKKVILSMFILTCSFWSYGQIIELNYNSVISGQNITATYNTIKNRNHNFSFGIGCNISRVAHPDNQEKIFYKRLFATKPLHYFNLNFSFQRFVLKNLKTIEAYLFYDLQVKYAPTRNVFPSVDYDSTRVTSYVEQGIIAYDKVEYFGPFTWFENTIGIGYNVKLADRLYLKNRIGLAIAFILGNDDQLVNRMRNSFGFELGGQISTGFGYEF